MSVAWKGNTYIMIAKLALETAQYERWELHGKTQLFYFENNRPALHHGHKRGRPKWKLIKGLEYLENDPDDGALLLRDVWEAIENGSVGKKVATFLEVRNKR